MVGDSVCTPVQVCADRRLTANGTEVIPKPVNERRSLWPKHQRVALVRELLSQHLKPLLGWHLELPARTTLLSAWN